MTEQLVLTQLEVGYRILTLNRPDKLNAFNDAMHEALRVAIEAYGRTVRRVLELAADGQLAPTKVT